MADKVYGFDAEGTKRIVDAVRTVEHLQVDATGKRGRRLSSQLRGLWAKLTSSDDIGISSGGYSYAWKEQYWADTEFSDVSDGLTGTVDENYAVNVIEGSTTNSDALADGTIVWLLPGFDSDGLAVWLFSTPHGFTGTSTRWGQVSWNGSTLTQTSNVIYYQNGLLVHVGDETSHTIDTTTECGGS